MELLRAMVGVWAMMLGMVLGMTLGYLAIHKDISDQIDKGYVQNLFKGKVIVIYTKNMKDTNKENKRK